MEIGKVETEVILFIFLISASAFHSTESSPYELIGPISLFIPGNSVAGLSFGPVSHGQQVVW